MLDHFYLRYFCIAIIEVAAFPIVAMRFEPKMRKLAPYSIGTIVLVASALFTVILCGYDDEYFPFVARAAISLSISAFGYTYTASAASLWLLLWKYLHSKREAMAIKEVVKDWRNGLKSLAIISLGYVLVWVAVFGFNLCKAHREMVINPPAIQLKWAIAPGIAATGDISITPEFLRSHHQYIIEVSSTKKSIIHTSLKIRFQFPFVVEGESRIESNVNARFDRAPSLPFWVNVPAQAFGKRLYRYYILSVDDMPPDGWVRIIVMLNSDPPGWAMETGTGMPGKPSPLAPQAYLVHSPMVEWVEILSNFSFGGVSGRHFLYAPFYVDADKLVSLGHFEPPPQGVQVLSEAP